MLNDSKKSFAIWTLLLSVFVLSGCEREKVRSEHQTNRQNDIQQQFNAWKAKQDPKLIDEYFQFISQYLIQKPTKLEVMSNRNFMSKVCESERFSIPPKKEWNNITGSLKLLNQLHQQNYFQRYTITAMYRSPTLNSCIKGAGKSKHLNHYAVDFHVLKPKETNQKERENLVKSLCQFWKTEGKTLKMGLGVYGNNRYHIDTQGYRTWGKDFKSKSSLCLSHSNSA